MHDYVSEYAALAEKFAVTVASSDLSVPVPACPRWSTYDMVTHLGNIASWAATIVETGRSAQMLNDEPATREPVAASEWYVGKAEDLHEVLRVADPHAECWNFAGVEPRARFWFRRQVHETAMHLVDLQQAAEREAVLSPSLCADGIDEVLSVFVPLMASRGRLSPLPVPLTVTAVDVRRSWTLVPGDPPSLLSDPSTTADGDSISGPASVLWTLLWKRLGRSRVDGSLLVTDPELSYAGDQDRAMSFFASQLTP